MSTSIQSPSRATPNRDFTSPTKPSTPSSKNYHPYLIQSTSSSLLTRSNSSPAPPASPSGHRSSRSMSSLNHILEGNQLQNQKEKEKEDRRRSMESPIAHRNGHGNGNGNGNAFIRPSVKRSGTLPEFLNHAGKNGKTSEKELDLPLTPKLWTPSELAQYLGHTLRTGGPEGTGQILPSPLVEDIKSWVLRQRVSGRDFIKGSLDGWGNTTRPPPFLPLLQTIARRLRRHSFSGKIESVPAHPDDSFGRGSVLMEEDEGECEIEHDDNNANANENGDVDEGEDGISGVRRMAIAFDARSSASETSNTSSASGDEDEIPIKLKPQWTGESVNERWKAWEGRSDTYITKSNRNRKASDVSSITSDQDHQNRFITEKNLQDMISQNHEILSSSASESEEEDENEHGGTIKAPPAAISNQSTSINEGLTPPPPYTSSFPDTNLSNRVTSTLPTLTECLTPERANDGRYSITPTPERTSNNGLGILDPSACSPDTTPSKASHTNPNPNQDSSSSPHMKNISNHQNPYAALRRRSSSSSKYPSTNIRNLTLVNNNHNNGNHDHIANDEEDDDEEGDLQPAQRSPANPNFIIANEELQGSRWTTARRVTLRPSKVQNVFDNDEHHTDNNIDQDKDNNMADQLNVLMNRIKELEHKLEDVTKPKSMQDKVVKRDNKTYSILDLIGYGDNNKNDDDGLPRRVRELPAYLFLVGVGVGAIMVRVLLGRGR
ncbi:uncharacterized protein IL334_000625 [Kwoniella shivajii]|uniref:Uncharacterized protein n=1 Tax=Kwoniella shivajii TaxID=564305 RepID=A0ABZ1CTW2_9TREE|nr:hypothetical protein IL334_000625 [Kwoniella shivajii]